MEDKKTLIERHIMENGNFDLVGALNEIDARIKSTYMVIDEVKELIQGYGVWSKEVTERLDELKPKIKIATLSDYNNTIKGL